MKLVRLGSAGAGAVGAALGQPPAGFSKSTSLLIKSCFVPAALSHASSQCFRNCARFIDRYLDRTADSAADIDWGGADDGRAELGCDTDVVGAAPGQPPVGFS